MINPRTATLDRFLDRMDHERMYVPDTLAREALRFRSQLDESYLDRWADELSVREVLDELRAGIATQE